MSKLLNFGAQGGTGGWYDKTNPFLKEEIDNINESVKPRKNPRVAVPSPFARFQIIQEAFDTVRGQRIGNKTDERDLMLVSQVLDVLELIYNKGISKYNLSVTPLDINNICNHLIEKGEREGKIGLELLGISIRDYAEREHFGMAENSTLYVIHSVDDVLAITSPTSIVLPTPNAGDWTSIMLPGDRPIFSEDRSLSERNADFIIFLFRWFNELQKRNGKLPEPLDNFGLYLESQRKTLSDSLKAQINEEYSFGGDLEEINVENVIPEIWGMPFYCQKAAKVSDSISSKTDLKIAPTVAGAPSPLVLSNNIVQSRLKYTADNVFWDSKNSGLDYSDPGLKDTPVELRNLPDGSYYADGFIYEHDFLADSLFMLPYRFNSESFFDGNVEGLDENAPAGFIPPVKELYFKYFTIEDLRKNIRMAVKQSDDSYVMEVTLNVPVTSGRNITLKKTYYMGENMSDAIEDVTSKVEKATGLIAPNCSVALTTLPFNRAFTKNYYAFQLAIDSFGLKDVSVDLKLAMYPGNESEEEYDEESNFKRYVRRREEGKPILVSYALDGGNFDYLKLDFKKDAMTEAVSALLIPKKDIPHYKSSPEKQLEFCFDFGTSNTFVAVKNEKGLFMDFKLPTDPEWMVSTIHRDTSNSDDTTIAAFDEYCRQEFLPIFSSKRKPFPIPTVLSVPAIPDEESGLTGKDEEIPMLSASIPFTYGSEDYGRQFNSIKGNLKWQHLDRKAGKEQYTVNFINELMFLAYVFAMSNNANLEKCSVTWTYPLSMRDKHVKSMSSYWKQAFGKYFMGNDEERDGNVTSFPESMAPMLYLLEKVKLEGDTGISVDIGGGTCDIVVVPDDDVEEISLSSVGFGANCIFGLSTEAIRIPMFKNAIEGIEKEIKKKATASKGNKEDLEKIAKNIRKLLDDGRSADEMSTYLFNLHNNANLASMAGQVSFNKWIQDHEFYHTVFIYYYAALIYYIADLWKSFDDIEKPCRIFFSGSGSKLLDIICKGNMDLLSDYTTELFNIFAKDSLDRNQLRDDITVRMEQKEPKQITAKGAIMNSGDEDLKRLRKELKDYKEAIRRTKFHHMAKEGSEITYEDLRDPDVQDTIAKSILDFHAKLSVFLKNNEEDFEDIMEDINRLFLNQEERVIAKRIRGILKKVSKQTDDPEDQYPDVPFFALIKYFIENAMVPEAL